MALPLPTPRSSGAARMTARGRRALRRLLPSWPAFAAAVLFTGCGDLGTDPGEELGLHAIVPVDERVTFTITFVGKTVEVPVRVVDEEGLPVPGVEVSFSPVGGGSTDPERAVTDGEGVATSTVTVGTVAGAWKDGLVADTDRAAEPREIRFSATYDVRLELDSDELRFPPEPCGVSVLGRVYHRDTDEEWNGLSISFEPEDTTLVELRHPSGTGTYRGQGRLVFPLRAGETDVLATFGNGADTVSVIVEEDFGGC